MATEEITTFEDLVGLLERNPEYRERLHRIMLDDEFLQLPTQVRMLLETAQSQTVLLQTVARTQEEHGRTLAQHSRTLEEHTVTLAQHSRTLEEHTVTLAQHSRTLEEHTVTLAQHSLTLQDLTLTLAQHSRTLEEHTVILAQHSRTLEQHTLTLAQHTGTLDEHTLTLAEHSRILAEHTVKLDDHGRKLDRHENQLSRLLGDEAERRFRRNAPACFSRLLRRIRVTDRFALADLADDAVDAGVLTEGEQCSLLALDLAIHGLDRENRRPKRLAIEVSSGIGESDIMRASDRSRLLEKLTGDPVVPVVAGYSIASAYRQLAEDKGVEVTVVAPPDAGEPEEENDQSAAEVVAEGQVTGF